MKKSSQCCILIFTCAIFLVKSQFINLNSHAVDKNTDFQQGQGREQQEENFISFPSFLEVDSNFPNHTTIPSGLRFTCYNREPGYYANPVAGCQVYHQCLPDGRTYTFLCGVGTIFNQRNFICDHWYNYNCAEAEDDYKYNANLAEPVQQDNDLQAVNAVARKNDVTQLA